MNAKRKPTKPVKAWALVHREDRGTVLISSYDNRAAARGRLAEWPAETRRNWRIARVEIREVGR